MKPLRPAYLMFSHNKGCNFRIERLAGPGRDQAIVLKKEYPKAGIEEIKVNGLERGIYLFLVENDTTVLVVTDINITTINGNGSLSMLGTEEGRPIPGLDISVFGKETQTLKTDENGIALLSGAGNFFIFTHRNENLWLGQVEIPKAEADKRIEIIPLGKRDRWFYFAALYRNDFLPIVDAIIKVELIRNDSLISLCEKKTDRFGSIVDSVMIDEGTDRMILITNDTRAVYSYRAENPVEESRPKINKISTDRLVYIPGDTLYGIFDQDSISGVQIRDPSGLVLEPGIEDGFFQLVLNKEGRYQIGYDASRTYFWVGRRGPLTFEDIPILIRPKRSRVRPGDEILFKVMAPQKKGFLLYRFCDQSGIVKVNKGRGKIRVKAEGVGSYELDVGNQDHGRRMIGRAWVKIRNNPEISIQPEPLVIRADQEAMIVALITPVVEEKTTRSKPSILKVGLNKILIDPPPLPGRYLLKVIGFGLFGHSIHEEIIDVH